MRIFKEQREKIGERLKVSCNSEAALFVSQGPNGAQRQIFLTFREWNKKRRHI